MEPHNCNRPIQKRICMPISTSVPFIVPLMYDSCSYLKDRSSAQTPSLPCAPLHQTFNVNNKKLLKSDDSLLARCFNMVGKYYHYCCTISTLWPSFQILSRTKSESAKGCRNSAASSSAKTAVIPTFEEFLLRRDYVGAKTVLQVREISDSNVRFHNAN